MVFTCARHQNDEGTPEVVWNHALKNTTFSYVCSLEVQCLKRTEKGLRKKKQVSQDDYYHGPDKLLDTEEQQNDDLFAF